MVRARRGGTIGCLLMVLVVAGIGYFSINVGEVYLRYYRYRDAMQQHVKFAASRSDEEIKRRLRVFADSIGLPEAAGKVKVIRRGRTMTIFSEYTELVDLPFMNREIDLSPQAQGNF